MYIISSLRGDTADLLAPKCQHGRSHRKRFRRVVVTIRDELGLDVCMDRQNEGTIRAISWWLDDD